MESDLHELSLTWKDDIHWKYMNDDYMGPDDNSVKNYYQELLDPGVEKQIW